MKKKAILIFGIMLMMAFLLAGCGGSSEEPETEAVETTQATEPVEEETTEAADEADTEAAAEEDSDSSFKEFKKTMDDYEDFMNSYCDLMEKYNSDPATYMTEYLEMNQKYLTVMNELEDLEDDDLTDEEMDYYLEVMNRINTRLAEVAY